MKLETTSLRETFNQNYNNKTKINLNACFLNKNSNGISGPMTYFSSLATNSLNNNNTNTNLNNSNKKQLRYLCAMTKEETRRLTGMVAKTRALFESSANPSHAFANNCINQNANDLSDHIANNRITNAYLANNTSATKILLARKQPTLQSPLSNNINIISNLRSYSNEIEKESGLIQTENLPFKLKQQVFCKTNFNPRNESLLSQSTTASKYSNFYFKKVESNSNTNQIADLNSIMNGKITSTAYSIKIISLA